MYQTMKRKNYFQRTGREYSMPSGKMQKKTHASDSDGKQIDEMIPLKVQKKRCGSIQRENN